MIKDNQDSWLEKLSSYNVSKILLILGLIILLTPVIFTQPTFHKILNFSNTGQIGDTIGGITSPFLNGLAVLLVFLAFKAQIKANHIFKNQTEYNNINDYINRIEEDKFQIDSVISGISAVTVGVYSSIDIRLKKIIYITSQFQNGIEMIEKFDGEKKFLLKRLVVIHEILYKQQLHNMKKELKESSLYTPENKSLDYQVIISIENLDKKLKEILIDLDAEK